MDKKDIEELENIIKEIKQDFKDLRKLLKDYFEEMEKDG